MSNFDLEVMARTAIGEARGESAEGMQAVMWTGVNRYTAKRWFSGQSIAGTLLKASQYSCWLPADPNYGLITNIGPAIALLGDALDWAARILQGGISDPTQGATHYANLNLCNPDWVRGAEQTVVIGKHTFFKNVA